MSCNHGAHNCSAYPAQVSYAWDIGRFGLRERSALRDSTWFYLILLDATSYLSSIPPSAEVARWGGLPPKVSDSKDSGRVGLEMRRLQSSFGNTCKARHVTILYHVMIRWYTYIMHDNAFSTCSKMAMVRPQRPKLGRGQTHLQNPSRSKANWKMCTSSRVYRKERKHLNTERCVGFYVQKHYL